MASRLDKLVIGCNPELHVSTGIVTFRDDSLSLEQRLIRSWLQLVVTIPTRNWLICYCVGAVAKVLNVGTDRKSVV